MKLHPMTYADTISRDTADFYPRIERDFKTGDITFLWAKGVDLETIDERLGLEDMVGRDRSGYPCLDVPKEIAEQVMV